MEIHISLETKEHHSVNLELKGNKVNLVFRAGNKEIDNRLFCATETVSEGERMVRTGEYHEFSSETIKEVGKQLKDCGEQLLIRPSE